MDELQLWVNPYPFCFGVIQAHPKLATVYLKKVVAYARSKGKDGGFPKLKWNIWKHMAVNKMLLTEEIAWMYFDAFNSVRECSREERFQDAEVLQQSHENKDRNAYRNNFALNTYEFVLFLYIQQSAKVSLRTSLVGEEWPGSSPRSRSPSPDLLDGVKTSSNIFDENSHRTFILNNLSEILEILSEPKKESRISLDAVTSLEFLIRGFVPKMNSIVPLSTLVTRQRYQMKCGYSKETQTFSCRSLDNWLRTCLGENPFGLTACLTNGIKPKWIMPKSSGNNSMKKARISSNGLIAPPNNKILFFTQCSNQTIARQTSLIDGSYIKFHRSHNSYFYLLSPVRFVSIEKCQNSTFVLGPVANVIRIVGCENVILITPARSVIISTSRRIRLYTATPTRPIIIGDHSTGKDLSQMVTVAPYHTYYPHLESHLANVGLVISPQTNQWNNPVCVNHISPSSSLKSTGSPGLPRRRTGGTELNLNHTSVYYTKMEPQDFYTFNIPFKTSSNSPNKGGSGTSTLNIPWRLPTEYEDEVRRKEDNIDKYKKAVMSSDMTKEERRAFRKRVEAQFTKWLEETGNKRQVDDLVELTKAYDQERK